MAEDLGALETGYRTLLEGCGLIPAHRRDWLIASGADRARFLNGLVTCDVRDLPPGTGRYGFFTGPKGRIVADVTIRGGDEVWLLDVPKGLGESVASHVLRYRVADQVEVAPAEPLTELVIAGSKASDVLSEVLGEPIPETEWGRRRVRDVEILCEDWIGMPSFRVRGPNRSLAELRSKLEVAGIVEVAAGAGEIVRVERGRPLFGVDFDDDCFPQETGLEEKAVSYTKGCYLGQEVVARIHYRGHVNRHLRGLRASGGQQVEVRAKVLLGGQAVGFVSTAVWSPSQGVSIALAMLHRKAEPGETVNLDSGVSVAVVELPFVVG